GRTPTAPAAGTPGRTWGWCGGRRPPRYSRTGRAAAPKPNGSKPPPAKGTCFEASQESRENKRLRPCAATRAAGGGGPTERLAHFWRSHHRGDCCGRCGGPLGPDGPDDEAHWPYRLSQTLPYQIYDLLCYTQVFALFCAACARLLREPDGRRGRCGCQH